VPDLYQFTDFGEFVSGNAIEGVTAYTAAKSAGERRESESESESESERERERRERFSYVCLCMSKG
jgi:hypothetical protein